jgi:hypothetical protein
VAAVIEALKGQWPAGRTTVTRSGLRPQEVIALLEALDDQHKAQATYAQVLADFGDVPPFAKIIEAEERHIDALTRLMHRYELARISVLALVGAISVVLQRATLDDGVPGRIRRRTNRSRCRTRAGRVPRG